MEKDSYPSDLSDNEWSVIEPLIPGPSRLGRPPRYGKRRVLDGLLLRGSKRYRVADDAQGPAALADLLPLLKNSISYHKAGSLRY